jgi:hypothetical protein
MGLSFIKGRQRYGAGQHQQTQQTLAAIGCNQPMQSRGVGFTRSDLNGPLNFHGRFLRSENFWLQYGAILRNAARIRNAESLSARDAVQRNENTRKNSVLNYETVALPTELRRREAGKTLHPPEVHTSALQRHHKGLANFPQRNALWSFTERGFEALDRFAEGLKAKSERLVVHRHNKASACSIRHLDCLLRRAV